MGAVDYGTQSLIFSYKMEADSDKFNKLFKNILLTGVHDGWQINKVANNKINIDPGTAIITDGTYTAKIETTVQTTQDIICSSTDFYVVARYAYAYSLINYIDFICTATPQTNDLVLGKLVYTGPVLSSVDYSYRTYANVYRTKILIDSETNSLYLSPETSFWYIGNDGYSISYKKITQKTLISTLVAANDYYVIYNGTSYSTSTTATGLAYSSPKGGWYDISGNRVLALVNYDGISTITIRNVYEGISSGSTLEKATGAEVNTGTNDEKYVTPKAIEDSSYVKSSSIPVKASAAEIIAGTDDTKFTTPLAIYDAKVGQLENEFEKLGVILQSSEVWEGSVLSEQTILYDSGTYKMWYRGNSGVNSKIGYATSTTGLTGTWTKYVSNPLSMPLPAGKTCMYFPYVLKVSTTYYMYASCYPGDNCYRWSSVDGITWSLDNSGNPVLSPSGTGWETTAIANTSVVYNAEEAVYPWKMLYEAMGTAFQIGYAYSTDGLSWTKYTNNPVLPALVGTWRHSQTGGPNLTKINGVYYTIYGGYNASGHWAIGWSRSTNMIDWEDYVGNPIISAIEVYEGVHTCNPSIIYDIISQKYVTYLSYGANQATIALAVLRRLSLWEYFRLYEPMQTLIVATGSEVDTGTNDEKYITPKAMEDSSYAKTAAIPIKATAAEVVTGTNDTKFTTPLAIYDAKVGQLESTFSKLGVVLSADVAWEGSVVTEQTILYDSGTYKMWYRGNAGVSSQIGYATSINLTTWTKYGSNPLSMPLPAGKTCMYFPFVLKVGATYYMYASCYPGDNCYRWSSSDGITWSLDNSGNPVISTGAGWKSVAIANTAVIYDSDDAVYPWRMLYEALGSTFQIGYAYSADGLSWTEYSGNPVLPIIAGTWRSVKTGNPDLVKINGLYYAIYGGGGSSGGWKTGVSCSVNMINWEDFDGNPIIEATEGYEGSDTCDPSVIYNVTGQKYVTYIFYGADQSTIAIAALKRLSLQEYFRLYEPIQELVVATGAEVDTGTDDEKYVTPKAMEDSSYAKTEKATGAEINTGTDDVKFATPKAIADSKIILADKTTTGEMLLGENMPIVIDSAMSADGKYCGIIRNGTAGTVLVFGDLVYLDPTDSKWEKTDANAAAAADGDSRGNIGHCVLAANEDAATKILVWGVIRADAKFPALTINAPVYVSETAGEIVVTQPTTTDVVIRVLGFALTADEYFFCPSSDYITHT